MSKMKKHEKAIKLLGEEMGRLAGQVFARWCAEQNEETKKTVEAAEFFGKLMEGKLKTDDDEYLKPYLEPLWEINRAVKVLEEDSTKK